MFKKVSGWEYMLLFRFYRGSNRDNEFGDAAQGAKLLEHVLGYSTFVATFLIHKFYMLFKFRK